MADAILFWFTIWEFKGVTIPQTVVVAKYMEPREYEHEYQRVLGRVEAYTPDEALTKFKPGKLVHRPFELLKQGSSH